MSAKPPPLSPHPPAYGEKPKSTVWSIVLAVIAALIISIALTFLTMGYFAFFIFVGLATFGLIGAQYFIWGWLFERIYRNGKEKLEE